MIQTPLGFPAHDRGRIEDERGGRIGITALFYLTKAFDPKKLVSFVDNPKFELPEQRREIGLLQSWRN